MTNLNVPSGAQSFPAFSAKQTGHPAKPIKNVPGLIPVKAIGYIIKHVRVIHIVQITLVRKQLKTRIEIKIEDNPE
ncbi:MAG: hypothetical protein OEU95_10165 [Nitrospirota bacterium]|nr:hypothetical protein [Nitrospirota bacterium]